MLTSILPAAALAQSTWYVDVNSPCPGSGTLASPYCSLQYAIDQATTMDGDTLLVLPGTYAETVVLGKALILSSTDGASATTLANVVPPGFLCSATVRVEGPPFMPVELRGFTIRCGLGHPPSPSDARGSGGGIHARSVALNVRDCEITGAFLPANSVCLAGGGLYYEGPGFLDVRDSTVRKCSALQGGGLACIGPTVNMLHCVIEDNGAQGLPSGSQGGGGYFTSGHSFLRKCLIQRNWTASEGGGLWGGGSVRECQILDNRVEQGSGGGAAHSFLYDRCVLAGNQAEQYGGGAYQSVVHESTVRDNSARLFDGGGAWDCSLWKTTLERNSAGGSGGGAALGSLGHCNVRDNTAAQRGGGIFGAIPSFCVVFGNRAGAGGSGIDTAAFAERCTIADNHGPAGVPGSFGVMDCDLRDSIVWNNQPENVGGASTATYCDVQGGWPGIGNLDADPLFWHERSGDLHLGYGSPCIDSADPLQIPDPDGSLPDMGALWADPLFCGAAFAYCTAKTNSLGCTPHIASQGTCTAGQDGFFVTASAVINNKPGLLLWGEQWESVPFSGGTLCVQPRARTPAQSSGGHPPPDDCSGSFSFHFSASYMAQHALPTGISLVAQYWYRDPSHPDGTAAGLSDALQFMICAP